MRGEYTEPGCVLIILTVFLSIQKNPCKELGEDSKVQRLLREELELNQILLVQ